MIIPAAQEIYAARVRHGKHENVYPKVVIAWVIDDACDPPVPITMDGALYRRGDEQLVVDVGYRECWARGERVALAIGTIDGDIE